MGLAEKEEDSDASHPTELQTPLRNPKDLEAQLEATSMEFLKKPLNKSHDSDSIMA